MTDGPPPDLPEIPILVRRGHSPRWLKHEPVFYMMAENSLMVCRNNEFFRSCVPARAWPPGLAHQKSFLKPKFPKLSRRLFERVVGFFHRIEGLYGSEAGALLVWDRESGRVGVNIPAQTATVVRSYTGHAYPIGLEYFPPTDLGENLVILGDIHSHARLPAYSSGTDIDDESFRPGLHVVVGRLHQEPPDIHVEAVADGTRFLLAQKDVIGGYRCRRYDFPDSWIGKVEVDPPVATVHAADLGEAG